MRIGITERGDAGRDLAWVQKCLDGQVDGVIAVTKSLTEGCGRALIELTKKGFPAILHLTCTGWGGTWLEPCAFTASQQLDAAVNLVKAGFPLQNLVIRIDPVVPTNEGIMRAISVLNGAYARELIGKNIQARLRFSILDEYRHVKQRLYAIGKEPFYGSSFQCSPEVKYETVRTLAEWLERKEQETGHAMPLLCTCGEDTALAKGQHAKHIRPCGCISNDDLVLMGLPPMTGDTTNPQGRQFCRCLSCKTELLDRKHPCKNACLYCYWKN